MRHFGHFSRIARIARGCRIVLVGGAFCLVPTTFVHAADDIATSVVDDSLDNSVVVAKSKLDPAEMVDEQGEGLQPISTVAEKEPQLADPEQQLEPPTSEVSASAAQKAPIKVASNTTEVETAPAEMAPQPPQPAVFHGIQPGVSTKKQLIDLWGTPDEVGPTETGQLMKFHMDSFRGVEVLVEDGLVTLMKISLHAASSPDELAQKVAADPQEAVKVINDETGHVAAYAYPERGIVMVIDTSDDITPQETEQVSEMLLQPLDAETFCLRAEQRTLGNLTLRIADLKQAVTLAPREAHAHWMLSRALTDAGLAEEAEAEAKRAVDLESDNMAYRQQWGKTLAAVGKYDNAVIITREVLDAENVATLTRAAALHEMGLLASLGDASIAGKAVGFHNMAIAEADKLATSDNAGERREAKRLLVGAHLAIAIEISHRDYEDNMDNVAQWVTRASALAEELIENDGGDLGLRITVAERSLAALASFKPSNNPEPLIHEIEETLKEIKSQTDDPLWMDQLEWTIGVAYQHALEIEHHRRHPKQALEYSEKAIELMADKAEARRELASTEQVIGKLYFHIGAVHAVHESEHGEAVEWYDRAFPLMVNDKPKSELLVPRHEGEALVSMAVSYWDQDDQDRAIKLTEMGADLIEQAVTGGVITKENLAVPYGNLAAMHKQLGNTAEAQRYAKLVDSVKAATSAEAKPPTKTKSPGVAQNRSRQRSSATASRRNSTSPQQQQQQRTNNRSRVMKR
ncbi:hypothetical protein [Aeoliella sp.]|uniref:tetratricopeptide repeat protein n=1 Tax=Aeoliella sp. TaxID=2795800 RepID=UPI003CCC3CF3